MITSGTSPASFSGYLEQRLSPAGVERVRSAAVARLGPPVREADARDADAADPLVLYGGQLFSVGDPAVLGRRLLDLSWLPERMWRTREVRAYAPLWYVACYGGWQESVRTTRVLSILPHAAEVLLGARTPTRRSTEPHDYCVVLTAREKNIVVEALEDEESGVVPHGENLRRYVVGPVEGRTVTITFEVVLPHGRSAHSAG